MTRRNRIAMVVHCPHCGAPIDGLYTDVTTADAVPETLRHDAVPLESVSCCYAQCDQCDTWVDLVRRPGAAGTRPSDFTLTWDPDRERLVARRQFFTRLFRR